MTAILPALSSAAESERDRPEYLAAAQRLYGHLTQRHWNGHALIGPDPGIRFNARLGRFIKSYLSFVPWRDDLVYLQAQGYWILNNWLMFDLLGDGRYAEVASVCSDHVLRLQRPEGYWDYPNPEWRGRIATVEGSFAALGLLESFARLQDERWLQGAQRWYQFLVTGMRFRRQTDPDMLAVNYFAHEDAGPGGVPNNSTMTLWVLARLAELSGDDTYRQYCAPMIRWLAAVQLPSGELPYAVGPDRHSDRVHFLCYQYNAFEFVDLVHYLRITGDDSVRQILARLADYLAGGLTGEGFGRYNCLQDRPEVTYYTTAIAHALSQATQLGLGQYAASVAHAYRRVLAQQRSNGAFACYSRKNYRVLSDRRSYPRYLSMILHHLLREVTLSQ